MRRLVSILLIALCTTAFFFHRRAGVDITTGLQIHLPLDGNTTDTSGQGNNGTFSGGTPSYVSVGWGGTALDCDGADDLVTVSDDASFTDATTYTITACINIDGYGESDSGRIVDIENESATTVMRWVTRFTNAMGFEEDRYATTSGEWRTNNGTISFTTDYAVAFSYNTSTEAAQYYVDGSAVTTNITTDPDGAVTATTGDLHVCNNAATARAFDGRMGHFRFYTVVKSAAEIAQIASVDCGV